MCYIYKEPPCEVQEPRTWLFVHFVHTPLKGVGILAVSAKLLPFNCHSIFDVNHHFLEGAIGRGCVYVM